MPTSSAKGRNSASSPRAKRTSETKSVNQELLVDKQVQPMTRNETIVAIKDCTTSGLRAVVLYGKRKINGFTTEVVVDVTCAPHH